MGVYPNPISDGQLHVNTVNNCNRIELYDILGRFLHAEVKTGTINTFSLPVISPGTYLLRVYTDSGNLLFKVLVR